MDIKKHTFKFRTGDTDEKGGCTFIGGSWVDKTTDELFKGKRILIFSLPGAFTPTCSGEQLPRYDMDYDIIKNYNIDDVYCVSVNDAFVMNAWARDLGINKVKMIPDGCGTFTRNMGMLVNKPEQGFGFRSWRYAAIINDCKVEKWFVEPGFNNESNDADPYEVSNPQNVLNFLTKA
jgi:peroxiredoxin